MDKSQIRKQMLQLRQEKLKDAELKKLLDQRINQKLLNWLNAQAYSKVGFYWPINSEPNVTPAITQWLNRNKSHEAFLPVTHGKQMSFYRWYEGCPMIEGKFKIMEPLQKELGQPELLIVPCVAADKANYRIGYGAGFYDRYLSACPTAAVGVCYSFNVVDSISQASFDIPLGGIISD